MRNFFQKSEYHVNLVSAQTNRFVKHLNYYCTSFLSNLRNLAGAMTHWAVQKILMLSHEKNDSFGRTKITGVL